MSGNSGNDRNDADDFYPSPSASASTPPIPPPPPKLGPEPLLLSRKEVDALYETFRCVIWALQQLQVEYVVTGGTLLGAVRQHSILFCDDDIDIAILDPEGDSGQVYAKVKSQLQLVLDEQAEEDEDGDKNDECKGTRKGNSSKKTNSGKYQYQIRPWEGGDRIRPRKVNTVFVDLFVLRQYRSPQQLVGECIGVPKKNGQPQSRQYVESVLDKVVGSCRPPISRLSKDNDAFWQFSTRKAVEMWPKEVYREYELFPLRRDYKFGPMTGICGPNMPVVLLKRAFGADCFDVYYESASHTKGHDNNTNSKANNYTNSGQDQQEQRQQQGAAGELPPFVSVGGTWESGEKQQLQDVHYLPVQPLKKRDRRPTFHCRERLLEYLQHQSDYEREMMERISLQDQQQSQQREELPSQPTETGNDDEGPSPRPRRTVYMDGVFDLFHIGHLEAIRNAARLGDRLVVGVTGDDDATGYKRVPIVPQSERVDVIDSLQYVDKVVCPCPLVVTESFMNQRGIDLVVHGFADDADFDKQREFFDIPIRLNKFRRIPYHKGLSTTERINRIQHESQRPTASDGNAERQTEDAGSFLVAKENVVPVKEDKTNLKPQWFGATLAAATNNSRVIPTDPFPLHLRIAIEPHIQKARTRRQQALDAIRHVTGTSKYEQLLRRFTSNHNSEGLSAEIDFDFDPVSFPLREAFLASLGLPDDYDLSCVHQKVGHSGAVSTKDRLFYNLTQQPSPTRFQQVYDDFVTSVCAPQIAESYASCGDEEAECDEIFYQCFPCIRVVQPDEFSIGPHADVSYGHNPCSVNFYLPLTPIGGSSALFLESRKGSEDWHAITGDYGRFDAVSVRGNVPFRSVVVFFFSHAFPFFSSLLSISHHRDDQTICGGDLHPLDDGEQNRLHPGFARFPSRTRADVPRNAVRRVRATGRATGRVPQ